MSIGVLRHIRAIETGVKHLLFYNRLTAPYPEARQMVNERYRGMIGLDIEKCISCKQCANVCPASAIKMIDIGEKKKYPGIDYARCVFCGFCVSICPRNALFHSKLHDFVYYDYEESRLSPREFAEGVKDPYDVPGGFVQVTLDPRKGLTYMKMKDQVKEGIEMKDGEAEKGRAAGQSGPRREEEGKEGGPET